MKITKRDDCCVESWWQGFKCGWEQAEKGNTKLDDHKFLWIIAKTSARKYLDEEKDQSKD